MYVREGHKTGIQQNAVCSLERHTNKKGLRIFSFIVGKVICLTYTQEKKKSSSDIHHIYNAALPSHLVKKREKEIVHLFPKQSGLQLSKPGGQF